MNYLTKTQTVLLKRSFRQVDTQMVAHRFYETLFERYPNLKPLFPKDISELRLKLMSVFELIVFSYEEKLHDKFGLQQDVKVALGHLGQQHYEKGVREEHYPLANNLLIEILTKEHPLAFPLEVVAAWVLSLEHLTFAMLNPAEKQTSKTQPLRDIFANLRHYLKK